MPVEMVELECRNCGGTLASENFVERLSMARCQHCNAVFAVSLKSPSDRVRAKMPKPERLERIETNGELSIIRPWWSFNFVIIAIFAVVWNGFMIAWNATAITDGLWLMAVAGIFHTAVGLGLIYGFVAGFRNKTYITISRHKISIEHKPMPWPGNKIVDATKIRQLYCIEKRKNGKNGVYYSYALRAVLSDSSHVTIIKSLKGTEMALYLEQEIEQHLRLANESVEGELKHA